MNVSRYRTLRLAWGVGTALAASLAAADPAAQIFESRAPSAGVLVIEGGSNVKDWDVRGEDIRGRIEIAAATSSASLRERFAASPLRVEVRIPVASLSGGSRGMDRRMQEALLAEAHPSIGFVLTALRPDTGATPERAPRFLAEGELTIAGETRTIRMPVVIIEEANAVRIEGEAALRMTDFGIDPPRALLGALRTDDDVTVRFTWTPAAGR